MAKAKKQRADKSDEKLKIEGDFEDVIGVLVNVSNKKEGAEKAFKNGQGAAREKSLEKKKWEK